MIRPLRARHRAVFAVLALVLPALWVAALLARAPEPVESQPLDPPPADRDSDQAGAASEVPEKGEAAER